MSENVPNPPIPPAPGEPAKVQPKKETVRIALPPKPTAAPTVRLPSPPPGGAVPAAPAAAAPAAPKPPSPPAGAAAPSAAIKSGSPAAAPAAPMTRAAAPASFGGGVSGLDRGLSVAVAVLGLAFLIHVAIIALGIQVE